MSDMHQQMKTCHYCGQAVKLSSHMCPHCGSSLAELDQQEWERLAPTAEPPVDKPSRKVLPSGTRKALLVVALCCFLYLAAVITISIARFMSNGAAKHKAGELPSSPAAAVKKPERLGAASPQSGKTSFIRIHENPTLPDGAASSEEQADSTESKESSSEERERRERVQRISAQIFKELLEEETITADTIHLKSGREIDCDIISRSDAQLTISHRGVTTTLNRDAIESVEHRSPEDVRQETEKLAMARANEIVSLGLVRHGGLWITPEERARRMQAKPAPKESEQASTQTATEKPLPEEPGSQSFDERTDREKLESLLALVRKTKTVDADFFGGTLHIENRSKERARGNSDNASFIAFEAKGRQINLFQLSDFLRLPVAASGLCNASVDASLDERDPRTLSGEAQVIAEHVTIPPFATPMLVVPPNEEATVTATLSADKGAVVIKSLRLDGTAYSLEGGGIILLANRLEQSQVKCSFSILFNESPTVTDTRVVGKGAQYLLNALSASKREIPIKILGTLSAPEILLTHQSALGSVRWRLNQ